MNHTDHTLTHHGIMGQKKGRRRYQLPDGTYTEEGKRRRRKYGDAFQKIRDQTRDGIGKGVDKARNTSSKQLRDYRNITNEFAGLNRAGENVLRNQRSRDRRNRERLDLSDKSDQELRRAINRELLERQYNDVFNSPDVSRGRRMAEEALSISGDVLAVTAAGLGAAVSVKKLLGK